MQYFTQKKTSYTPFILPNEMGRDLEEIINLNRFDNLI